MPLTNEDDFDAAFADAIADVVTPDPTAAAATIVAEDSAALGTESAPAEPAPAEPAPATPAEPEPAEPEPEPAPATPAEPAPAPAPATPAEPTPAPATPAEPTPAPAPAPSPATPAEPVDIEAALFEQLPDPVLTEDQQAAIAKFREDWPDMAAAMDLQANHLQALVEARVSRLVGSVVHTIYKDIAPLATTANIASEKEFRTAVLEKHEDFDTVMPNLEPWIKSQPAYLQDAYFRAYNDGSVEDVIDLVTRFKSETGVLPKVLEPAANNAGEVTSGIAAAKAAELAPVQAKRTAPKPTGEDPEDFDSAFEIAAASYAK